MTVMELSYKMEMLVLIKQKYLTAMTQIFKLLASFIDTDKPQRDFTCKSTTCLAFSGAYFS